MRIISGKWKGKRLTAPKNLPTRPTTDFAKEALFNILNNRFYIDELNVIDLFAGIGSISFEFASRGAQKITAVEKNAKCVAFISETAEQLGFEQIIVIRDDVFSFLKNKGNGSDMVFADPPFDLETESYNQLIQLVFNNGWLAPDGLFVLEHGQHQNFETNPYFSEQKKYGSIYFSFFEYSNPINHNEEE